MLSQNGGAFWFQTACPNIHEVVDASIQLEFIFIALIILAVRFLVRNKKYVYKHKYRLVTLKYPALCVLSTKQGFYC